MIAEVSDPGVLLRLKRDRAYVEMCLAEELYDTIANDETFMTQVREMCRLGLLSMKELLDFCDQHVGQDQTKKLLKEAIPLNAWYRIHPNVEQDINRKCAEIDKKEREQLDQLDKKMKEELKASNEGQTVSDVIAADSKLTDAAHQQMQIKLTAQFKRKEARIGHKKSPVWEEANALNQDDIDKFIKALDPNNPDSKKFDPSDCSDIFRLIATVIEEFPMQKLKDEIFKNPKAKDAEKFHFWKWLQKSYRETSGRASERLASIDDDVKVVFYCDKCNKVLSDSEITVVATESYKCANPGCTRSVRWRERYEVTLDKWEGTWKVKCGCGYSEYMVLHTREASYRASCGDRHAPVMKIEEKLKCFKCKDESIYYLEPHQRVMEKPGSITCAACDEAGWLAPVSVKPFWQGAKKDPKDKGSPGPDETDALRARRNWKTEEKNRLATHKLLPGSVTRTIDRIFGLPERADISGTTADSIFGMELVFNLHDSRLEQFGTDRGNVTFRVGSDQVSKDWKNMTGDEKTLWWTEQANKFPEHLILLPVITMGRLNFHSILECALTFSLTGYLKSYHVGYYTSLWPPTANRTGVGERLYSILEKWQDHPLNVHAVFDLDKDGNEIQARLFNGKDENEFREIARVDYSRYVLLFKPMRDRLKNPTKYRSGVNYTLLKAMLTFAKSA